MESVKSCKHLVVDMGHRSSDLENLQFWFDKETTMYRQFHLQKAI